MRAPLSPAEQQRLALWREAIMECLAIACQYASMAEISSDLEDAAAFDHSVRNFIAAARTTSSIFKENRTASEAKAA